MANSTGSFVWHDLMTTDTDGAARFYGGVAGWKTQAWEEGGPYVLWMNGENAVGGMMALTDEMRKNGVPPHWMPSVLVESVDASAAKATSLGGKIIVPPSDIPGAGRYSIIADPQGVSISMFEPSGGMSGQGGGDKGGNGDFSWHELTTTDHKAAFDFYSKLFGWEKTSEHDMGAMGIYQMYGQNGVPYGGMMNKMPDMPAPPNWLCYIRVPDTAAAGEAIKTLGGQVIHGPVEVPGGDTIVMGMDPQGAAIAFHAVKKS